jgi:hypothetical protein
MPQGRDDGENERTVNVPITDRLRELAGQMARPTDQPPRPTPRSRACDVALALNLAADNIRYVTIMILLA